MSAIGDAVAGILALLTDADVPATADPDLIASLVSAHGTAALVMPPEVQSRVLARGMRLSVEVNLLGPPPGGHTQLQAVWDQLGPAMDALTCRQAPTTTTTIGGVTYPGYRLTATPNTPC